MPPGEERNYAIAVDTLRFAERTLRETGGRLRFTLEGFNRAEALREGSPTFGSVTSAEFRGILNNQFLRQRTDLFDKGKNVTKEVFKEAGVH